MSIQPMAIEIADRIEAVLANDRTLEDHTQVSKTLLRAALDIIDKLIDRLDDDAIGNAATNPNEANQ